MAAAAKDVKVNWNTMNKDQVSAFILAQANADEHKQFLQYVFDLGKPNGPQFVELMRCARRPNSDFKAVVTQSAHRFRLIHAAQENGIQVEETPPPPSVSFNISGNAKFKAGAIGPNASETVVVYGDDGKLVSKTVTRTASDGVTKQTIVYKPPPPPAPASATATTTAATQSLTEKQVAEIFRRTEGDIQKAKQLILKEYGAGRVADVQFLENGTATIVQDTA